MERWTRLKRGRRKSCKSSLEKSAALLQSDITQRIDSKGRRAGVVDEGPVSALCCIEHPLKHTLFQYTHFWRSFHPSDEAAFRFRVCVCVCVCHSLPFCLHGSVLCGVNCLLCIWASSALLAMSDYFSSRLLVFICSVWMLWLNRLLLLLWFRFFVSCCRFDTRFFFFRNISPSNANAEGEEKKNQWMTGDAK